MQAGEMLVIVSEVEGYDWFIGAPMEIGWRDGESYDMSELMVFPKNFVRVRATLYVSFSRLLGSRPKRKIIDEILFRKEEYVGLDRTKYRKRRIKSAEILE